MIDKGDDPENAFITLRSDGNDKWIMGTWSSNNDFMIKNWALGSSDKSFYINSSNSDIGIGTLPSYKLDIHSQFHDGIRVKTDARAWLVIDKGTTADDAFITLRTGGSDKWIVGSWNSDDNFMIRNWEYGGSSDNTFFIDAASSAIGLNTKTPYSSDMLGMYPDNDYEYGIYYLNDRTTSGTIYGADFVINNSYSGTSTNYGLYSDVEKDGSSNGTIYGLFAYANDDQTGTSSRYIRGVYGSASIESTSGTSYGYGLYGTVSGNADHGYGVYYSGGLGGSGTKNAVVRTDDGPKELYCLETPGNWFEDVGGATVKNGKSEVKIAADFLQTVSINSNYPMRVFITPNADMGKWWVEKNETSFTLFAPDAPDGSTFDFRVMAKRKVMKICDFAKPLLHILTTTFIPTLRMFQRNIVPIGSGWWFPMKEILNG